MIAYGTLPAYFISYKFCVPAADTGQLGSNPIPHAKIPQAGQPAGTARTTLCRRIHPEVSLACPADPPLNSRKPRRADRATRRHQPSTGAGIIPADHLSLDPPTNTVGQH
jgi:hypothetical protein